MSIYSGTRRMMAPLLMLFLTLALPALAADCDRVINNGRVIDPETMLDAVMNVGVKDGRIAVITRDKISGKEGFNTTGLVLTLAAPAMAYHSIVCDCNIHPGKSSAPGNG